MSRLQAELDLSTIQIGDRITFKAATREGCRKATRVVTGTPATTVYGGFSVKSYVGWTNFYVRPYEILEHHPRADQERPQ